MAETIEQGIPAKPEARLETRPAPKSAQKAMEAFTALRQRFAALPPERRRWLIASLAVIGALIVGLLWYAQRPDWRPLFTGLEARDVQQVSQELSAAGISYQLTPDGGGISVPAGQLDKARMTIAAKGMPQSGRLGFELFDKPNWVGSEFDEHVNYQRALEGELEHTIESIDAVRSARVHLVLPQPSLFSDDEKPAKASVVLKLKRPALDPDQADAIRSLVAGAVQDLSPADVTLVDADGRVDLKPRSKRAEDAALEQELEAKLVSVLEPLAGRDNIRASVNVSYDSASEDRTDEIYDPSQTAPLTMQRTEQTDGGTARPSGVPGTASNTPAGSPQGAVQGSAAAAAPGTPPLLNKKEAALPVYPRASRDSQSLKEENGTYAVTKHLIHTEQGPGRVRRISAAILVNDRLVSEGTGKQAHMVWKPRSGEEMRRLEQLARAAVGFDSGRGDQVVLENISFSTNAPVVPAPFLQRATDALQHLLETQPALLRTAMMGVLGLLLVLFVLRPAVQKVTASLTEPMLLTAGTGETAVPGLQAPEAGQEEKELPAPSQRPVEPRFRVPGLRDGILEHLAESIRRDATNSVRLLEAWIGTSNDAE